MPPPWEPKRRSQDGTSEPPWPPASWATARTPRSWTASSKLGHARERDEVGHHRAVRSNPFARANNVSFPSGAWTRDISHGEMIRAGNDQTLTIPSCRLPYLYQGKDTNAGGDYTSLPWRLSLLTQTDSAC
ncbi:non-reducing end alpha-L-arabinofuranosidase family hydrolase [Streptomyces bluensis]